MTTPAAYTDDDLAIAVASATSWRGVLRALGRRDTSAGSFRSARRRANQIGLDYSHFTGQRRWTDAQLSRAVAVATSWHGVLIELGLGGSGSSSTTVRAHAIRLGLNTTHLEVRRPSPTRRIEIGVYDPAHLRTTGAMLAASWFTLRGVAVSWPLEPCRYDLVAEVDGSFARVQVKTTTGAGATADVTIANSRRQGAAVYGPNEIDQFFVIDGELSAYLIPYEAVAGYSALRLGHYVNFRVMERGQLLSGVSSP